MALVIEDGTIVANANSFVTVQEIIDYALVRNLDLSSRDEELIEGYAIAAMDFIELKESLFQGARVDLLQNLPFPRSGVTINGQAVPNNVIPKQAIKAQLQLALDAANGIILTPNQTSAAVKREKVGPLETEYAVSETSTGQPVLTAAEGWLSFLYAPVTGMILNTYRV